MSTERLQKILAQAGIASRRKAEELIKMGLVTINGKTAQLGDKADFTKDAIKVEGKLLLKKTEAHTYLAFFKPKGVISMMADPEGRPNLADYLTKLKTRVFPIGRLDFNSEGILLLTNDGDLVEKIQKSNQFPRTYHVKLKGMLTAEMVERLKRGAKIGTKFIKPHSVRISEEYNKKSQVEMMFLNNTNLDVKAYCELKGFLVEKVTRTAFGHITLHGLEPGQYRIVPQSKLQALIDQPELGVKALELRHKKEKEIVPHDLRRETNFRAKAFKNRMQADANRKAGPGVITPKDGSSIKVNSKPKRSSTTFLPKSEKSFGARSERSERPRREGGFSKGPRSGGGGRIMARVKKKSGRSDF